MLNSGMHYTSFCLKQQLSDSFARHSARSTTKRLLLYGDTLLQLIGIKLVLLPVNEVAYLH